jgi:hypothetical protein
MFDKPRHQPFPLLKESFNVFKAMLPSQQHLVTTSFGLTESPAGAGLPIPGNLAVARGRHVPRWMRWWSGSDTIRS